MACACNSDRCEECFSRHLGCNDRQALKATIGKLKHDRQLYRSLDALMGLSFPQRRRVAEIEHWLADADAQLRKLDGEDQMEFDRRNPGVHPVFREILAGVIR